MDRPSSETAPPGRGPASPAEATPDDSAGARRAGWIGAFIEWLIWLGIAYGFYEQTGLFEEELASYRFGPTGWPRALAICTAIGATGQMLYRLFVADTASPVTDALPKGAAWTTTAQRAGILILPLVWLWLMPSIGFYVTTPLFIIALLLLLEVRSPLAILGVTAVVYGLMLVIFTRYFYVALPVGTLDGFYEANNWIIATARLGV